LPRVIALAPASLAVLVGQLLEIVGWGFTEASVDRNVLKKATMAYVDSAVCNAKDSYDGRVTSNMLCAGHDTRIFSCLGSAGVGEVPHRTVVILAKAALLIPSGASCSSRYFCTCIESHQLIDSPFSGLSLSGATVM
jgi:hypothetical protein